MAELSDKDLLAHIDAEEGQALGYQSGDLSRERQKALDYYNGFLPDVQAAEGRSDAVSTDVRDAVDGMLPDLLDVFLSSDDVVKFEPQGPEDEQAAAQATDATNYVFYRQNPGALILHDWFKSALMEKNGVVKYYHDSYPTPSIESYDGLTEVQFQMLLATEGVTVLQHSAAPDPQMQGMSLHDVQVRVVDKAGKVCIKGVPSEEFLICADHDSLSMRDVRFVEHRQPLTVSQIRAMGIDVNPDEVEDNSSQLAPEYTARRRFNEELQYGTHLANDPSQRIKTVCEISALIDRDGDGYAERRRIIKIGNTIYDDDYADHVPFAAICPTIMPYRFYGLSAADNTMDIMKIKSVVLRQMLDSLYLSITPQTAVMESMANLDDLLVRRPGGIVRTKTNPSMAIMPLEHKFVGAQAFPMMEYLDSAKENRTGFTRYSQGLDANSLNKTATGVSIISSAAAKRMKLIARMFAETGVKELMRGIKHLLMKHRSGKPMAMRLRGQWVNVDPREWKTQWDMTVNVGLGTNDKTAQAAHIGQIMGVQKGMREAGFSHIVNDQNIYNAAKRLSETAGFKQEGEFFTAPGPNNPPPQPAPPPEIIKAQMEQQSHAADLASQERIKQMDVMNGDNVAKIQQQTSVAVAQIKAASDAEVTRITKQADASIEIFRAGTERDLAEHAAQSKEKLQDKQADHATTMEVVKAGAKPNGQGKPEDAALLKVLSELARASSADREILRDGKGNIVGSRLRKGGGEAKK